MRESPPELSRFRWVTEHEIRFADLDAMGHVNHAAYLTLLENSRAALLMGPDMAATGLTHFSLVRLEFDYLHELGWPGRVRAAIGVERVGGSSFDLRQTLFTEAGRCCANGRFVIVAIDAQTRRPRRLPEAALAVLARWPMA